MAATWNCESVRARVPQRSDVRARLVRAALRLRRSCSFCVWHSECVWCDCSGRCTCVFVLRVGALVHIHIYGVSRIVSFSEHRCVFIVCFFSCSVRIQFCHQCVRFVLLLREAKHNTLDDSLMPTEPVDGRIVTNVKSHIKHGKTVQTSLQLS